MNKPKCLCMKCRTCKKREAARVRRTAQREEREARSMGKVDAMDEERMPWPEEKWGIEQELAGVSRILYRGPVRGHYPTAK